MISLNSLVSQSREGQDTLLTDSYSMRSCEEWKPFMAMIAIQFSFSIVNILLKKVLQGGLNHLVFITYRLVIATMSLAPIGYFCERNSRQQLNFRILSYLFFSSILGSSLTQYFFLLGIQYTSATFACAFLNIVPVLTFIMALPFGLETVNIKLSSGRAKILGTLVCTGGALLLTTYRGMPLFKFRHSEVLSQSMDHVVKLKSPKNTETWAIGSICLSVGTLLWSSWFILQTKINKKYPFQYSSTAIMSFFGAIQSSVLCFFTSKNLSVWILKGKVEIITVLYSGAIASGIAYVGMSWCVKKRGPVFTAAFSPLVQVMTVFFDIPILHEQLNLGSILGSIIVIIGLYILLWGKSKELGRCTTSSDKESEDKKEQVLQLQTITVPCDSRFPTDK